MVCLTTGLLAQLTTSKNTTDMLFNLPPAASGYSSILSNIGEVENLLSF